MEISLAAPYGLAPARNEPTKAMREASWKPATETVSVDGHFVQVRPYEDGFIFTRMDANDEAQLYICFVHKFSYQGRDVYVQKNVWQLPGCPKGFARLVMRYFSQNGNILVSDERQRKLGAEMWKRFVKEDTNDRFVYVQHTNGLSLVEPHTKNMMLSFAYQGNATDKLFVVSDKPVNGRVRSKW
jgi:hypothetical protein